MRWTLTQINPKIILFCLFVLILFCKCSNKKDWVQNICIDETVKIGDTIKVSDFVNFNWDSIYYFSMSIPLEEVEKDVGDLSSYYYDVGNKLILKKGQKIVYYKEFFPYPQKEYCEISISIKSGRYKEKKGLDWFVVNKKENILVLTPCIKNEQ